jgi:putative ABC transport system permease protein
VESTKFKFVIGGKNRDAIALYGLKADAKQNQLIVKQGRLPKHANEIVLDEQAQLTDGYQIGDHFKLAKSADVKTGNYEIVGFVDSPLYIDDSTRGATNIGSGEVQYFAYVMDDEMNLPVDTILTVRFPKIQQSDTFGKHYQNQVDAKVKLLKKQLDARKSSRSQELIAKPMTKIMAAQKQLNQAKTKLEQAEKQLKQQSHGKMTTTTALKKQTEQLTQKQAELTKQKTLIKKAGMPTYTWQTRADLAGFTGYGESSDRIAAIANVFPVFFFLLAALITFTTVTRMVEEARGEIGTLKALGFSRRAIAYKYTMYAFLAGILGTIFGSILGNQLLPRFVVSMYSKYVIGPAVVRYDWPSIWIAGLLAMFATLGAALLVVTKETQTVPAVLMRPKAPKAAKKILLERLPLLWNRLKFNQKISYRNLFRFKLRGLMTILGIAGGTALIITGFGIANSIAATGTKQFDQIFNYDVIVQSKSADRLASVKKTVAQSKAYQTSTTVHTAVVNVAKAGKKVDNVTMYVPDQTQQFSKFITLRDYQTHHQLNLSAKGVVISQKTATRLNLKKGSQIKVKTPGHDSAKMKVTGITENYTGNVIYTSKSSYQAAMNAKPAMKTLMVKLNQLSTKAEGKLSKHWIKSNANILGVSFTSDQVSAISSMTSQLSPVVMIFILLSGLLSFIVLYNLNNINISERLRELSTIKVLGFFNPEVTMYVARESIILAIVGILLGFGLGNVLTSYVIGQAETNDVVFPLTIKPIAYIVATVLMILFNLIVVYITHHRLKQVDMVEALKSKE